MEKIIRCTFVFEKDQVPVALPIKCTTTGTNLPLPTLNTDHKAPKTK
jgi:hypothetical protein